MIWGRGRLAIKWLFKKKKDHCHQWVSCEAFTGIVPRCPSQGTPASLAPQFSGWFYRLACDSFPRGHPKLGGIILYVHLLETHANSGSAPPCEREELLLGWPHWAGLATLPRAHSLLLPDDSRDKVRGTQLAGSHWKERRRGKSEHKADSSKFKDREGRTSTSQCVGTS